MVPLKSARIKRSHRRLIGRPLTLCLCHFIYHPEFVRSRFWLLRTVYKLIEVSPVNANLLIHVSPIDGQQRLVAQGRRLVQPIEITLHQLIIDLLEELALSH